MEEKYATGNKFDLFDLEENLLITFLHDRMLWVDFYKHISPAYFRDKNVAEIFKIYKVYFEKHFLAALPKEKTHQKACSLCLNFYGLAFLFLLGFARMGSRPSLFQILSLI